MAGQSDITLIKETPKGLEFKVFIQPRSSRNQIVGLHGGALKIKLTAPPVDGTANTLCIKYLAKCLDIPKSAIEIVSGHTARTKRILVEFSNDKSATHEKNRVKAMIETLAQNP